MRVLFSIAGFVAVLIAACAEPAPDSNTSPPQAEERRVLETEDEYVAAEINRDEAALRRLVDDRFVFNAGDGTTSGKEELIQTVLAMNMTGQTISERSVMIEGDLAIIFGTTELRLQAPGGEQRLSVFRYTSVYVKRQGQWRMLALQMAPRSPRK